MYDGSVNKRSGVVVISLPGTPDAYCVAYGDREIALLYPDVTSWTFINNRAECVRQFPHLPDRIIDNIWKQDVTISVAPWDRIDAPELKFLIEEAFRNRANCGYDLSRPMRRANS